MVDDQDLNFIITDLYQTLPPFPALQNFGLLIPYTSLRLPNIRNSALLRRPDPALIPWFQNNSGTKWTDTEKVLCVVTVGSAIIMTLYFVIKAL